MNQEERERVDFVEQLMKMIGAKWKPAIIYCLVHQGTLRYSELKRSIPDITQRILTMRLRELERDGFVKRTFHRQIPPRVDYEITKLGKELHPFFRDLCAWGSSRKVQIETSRKSYDSSNDPIK